MTIPAYFQEESAEILAEWDGIIVLSNVPGKLDWKALVKPIPCGNAWIQVPFEYDGSSSGIFGFIIPKWRHPIASARHDKRCRLLRDYRAAGMSKKNLAKLRKLADLSYKKDLSIGQTNRVREFLEVYAGYIGVRIGAYTGIGAK